MAKNKTAETKASVAVFLATIKDEKKRKDCSAIIDLFEKHTGLESKMWGPSIIGFGAYHYKYESGHEGDAPLVGLSPRVNAITLYFANPMEQPELLKKLGRHKSSKACIYIQKLEDVDTGVLVQMAANSIKFLRSRYPDKTV